MTWWLDKKWINVSAYYLSSIFDSEQSDSIFISRPNFWSKSAHSNTKTQQLKTANLSHHTQQINTSIHAKKNCTMSHSFSAMHLFSMNFIALNMNNSILWDQCHETNVNKKLVHIANNLHARIDSVWLMDWIWNYRWCN